ncbi:Mov34/MPN/PAD-1 family protein, partial [Xenorhabdus miraniensis]
MDILRKSIINAIMTHAKAEYPNECCGLVIQNGRRQEYVPCRNTAPSPTE